MSLLTRPSALIRPGAQHVLASTPGPAAMTGDGAPRLFSFGLCTDVQYADLPQGTSHGGTARYYRDSLPALRRAVAAWKERDVDFGMHLGDATQETPISCACRLMRRARSRAFRSALQQVNLIVCRRHCGWEVSASAAREGAERFVSGV